MTENKTCVADSLTRRVGYHSDERSLNLFAITLVLVEVGKVGRP